MKFSLIIATLGRKDELKDMLLSLELQKYDLSKLEIIIIDRSHSWQCCYQRSC